MEVDARFTVTAPRSVELQENIFICIQYNIFIIMRHNNRYGALLLLWDWFTLNAGLNLPINEVLYKVADFLLGKLLTLV